MTSEIPTVLIAEEQTAIPVTLEPPPIAATVTKGEGVTLAPTTTEAEDRVTEGQRDINRLWERTQSRIAMVVTFATIAIIGVAVIVSVWTGNAITPEILTLVNLLAVMTTLILSFYFSRTNHSNQGGIGKQPPERYTGR